MYIFPNLNIATSLACSLLFGICAQCSRVPLPSWAVCPPSGPLLPRPTELSRSQIIQAATVNLTVALDSAINGTKKAGFAVDNTSFSIGLVSPFQTSDAGVNDSIIWSYHHLGKNNINGTKNIDNDSQYLIGSVSKVFTDLILLKSGVNPNDGITKYLPGLEDNSTSIQWNNITISSLSDHLAGIPSNLRKSNSKHKPVICGLTDFLVASSFEFYSLRPLFQQLNFPFLDNGSYPICGVTGLSRACNKQRMYRSKPVATVAK
jgi:CubicO group peptidase (beta-lactamase class C family)